MRCVIQRVSEAGVTIGGRDVAAIGRGLLVLVGVEEGDTTTDGEWLAEKVVRMRVFPDDDGKMNRSVVDVDGGILVVSQFTLHASTARGNRPGFTRAARPEQAVPLYEGFLAALESSAARKVPRGVFGADMQVRSVNDGPVTILVDSRRRE